MSHNFKDVAIETHALPQVHTRTLQRGGRHLERQVSVDTDVVPFAAPPLDWRDDKQVQDTELQEGPFRYLSLLEAQRLGIADGEAIEVSRSVGNVTCKAQIDETIPKGRVGMHFR